MILSLRKFFLWLSGAESFVLENVEFESNRFLTIGISIFIEGLIAFIAAYQSVHFASNNIISGIIFALIYAIIILNIYRLTISTFRYNFGSSSLKTSLLKELLTRLIILIPLTLVNTQPLIISIFHHEIIKNSFGDQKESFVYLFTSFNSLYSKNASIHILITFINLLMVIISISPVIIRSFGFGGNYDKALKEIEDLQYINLSKKKKNYYKDEDFSSSEGDKSNILSKILLELEQIKNEQSKLPQTAFDSITKEVLKLSESNNQVTNFDRYFFTLVDGLTLQLNKINTSSQKLFNQGLIISFIGLGMYIGFIFFWLDKFQEKGFQSYHLYGIISTSLLFLFIEFLGAWFLKQYRMLSDLSIHLFKFKTVLDKYYLNYTLVKEFSDEKNKNELITKLFEQIKEEIKVLPDFNSKQSTSFAKEAIGSISNLTDIVKKLTEKG